QKYHQNECKIRETENDEKAFDSIQHKAVFKALKQHGVEDNYINILKETYDGGTSRVEAKALRSIQIFPGKMGPKSFTD
uniref:Reverse transcriptase domain-containing protein n=1 Tax=Amphiprion ocellaris TaxID=80972 RepID=A0AAQ5Z9B2_AMPOC